MTRPARFPPPLLLLLCIAVTVLGGCERSSGPVHEHDDPMQLRLYATPAGRSEAIANTLNEVMGAGIKEQAPIGRASPQVDGQVVVLAPASLQASIESAIKGLVGEPPESGHAPMLESVRMSYWMIDAIPGAGEDATALAEVSAALDAFRPSLGPSHFDLRERVSLLSAARGDRASLRSDLDTELTQSLRSEAGGVYAKINIQHPRINPDGSRGPHVMFNADLSLRFGDSVLLAQVPLRGAAGEIPTQRLLLIRADPAGAP